jgi:hypothetical protein
VDESALLDQAVANLRGLSDDIRSAANDSVRREAVPAVQGWTAMIDAAIANLVEVQRRARYRDLLATADALVDAIVEGPPAVSGPVRTRSG